MKKFLFLFALALFMGTATQGLAQTDMEAETQKTIDSLERAFQWKTGAVTIGDNLAEFNVPAGWRFLPAEQSNFVLTSLWGNPPGASLGMLFPTDLGPLDTNIWAFNLRFDEMGYVKDDDADEFDYADILEGLQKEAKEANPQRTEEGYPAIEIIGWAATPFYDKEKKVLHWAKEIRFGTDASTPNTLNYDVRVLGRKGVLSMNAIADMNRLEQVKASVPAFINSVALTAGNRYADFDSGIDNVAAWTIGGLVAGKILAKAGFFVIILKFIKPILLVVFGGGAWLWNRISRRKKEEQEATGVSEV